MTNVGSAKSPDEKVLKMGGVPEAYYEFVINYAPCVYMIPPNSTDPNGAKQCSQMPSQ